MLERFERLNATLSNWLAWIGLAALILMMAITCIDVIGAKIFLRPVFGAIDLVMLAQLIAIAFAGSTAQILKRHVQVEFFMPMFPQGFQAIAGAVINFLGFLLFAAVVWRLIIYGHLLQTGGEISSTARIPLFPLAYGVAFACIPLSLQLFFESVKSILMVVKK